MGDVPVIVDGLENIVRKLVAIIHLGKIALKYANVNVENVIIYQENVIAHLDGQGHYANKSVPWANTEKIVSLTADVKMAVLATQTPENAFVNLDGLV